MLNSLHDLVGYVRRTGREVLVIVDNDSIYAYGGEGLEDPEERYCLYRGDSPREELIDLLQSLGVPADYP